MIVKPRKEPTELSILKLLDARMNLSSEQKRYYFNLKKGYEGELQFDSLVEKTLPCECLILNDLLLKVNHTTFQIDSLMITADTIYLLEIKNYEEDYYYEAARLYKKPKTNMNHPLLFKSSNVIEKHKKTNTEMNNPLNQLNRSESLLRQLLQSFGFDLPIVASVIFINSEFTLYQSPLDIPFIFPTQVKRYLKQINAIPSQLTRKHTILAEKIISRHMEESPFIQLPSYDYDQLRKGIACSACNSLSVSVEGYKCVCLDCRNEESVADAVVRSTKEFKLLFPNEKITTSVIHDWCKVVSCKRRIQRILTKSFKYVNLNRWSYYE